jgi:hypothetical protein
LQETLTENPAQQLLPATASLNPNEAQGTPAPQDTVTLTGQTAQGQQAGENQSQSQFQQAPAFVAQTLFGAAGPANQNSHPPPTLPVVLPAPAQQQAANANSGTLASNAASGTNASAGAAGAANASNAALANSAGSANGADLPANAAGTPQQQLTQLDQTLQQLGIDPQSIPLFNRMAMLLYANDPAALQMLVQELQSQAQQVGQGAASAPANQSQAVNQNPAQALADQAQSAAPAQTYATAGAPPVENAGASAQTTAEATQAQVTVPLDVVAQFTLMQEGAEPDESNSSAGGAPQPTAETSSSGGASNDVVTAQFQGLPIAFAAVQQATQAASQFNGQGASLNLTV